MKIINERYRIVKKISETLNSLNYLVEDEYTHSMCLLKMLNRNVKHPFPLEYFKKEYVINSSLKHSLIRNPIAFETCVSIDGNDMAEPEYFFCTPFYQNPVHVDKSNFNDTVMSQIIDTLVFLHANDCFHGDIRAENLFLSDNNVVLFDISPFVPYTIGKQDDIKKIHAFLKPLLSLTVKKPPEDSREIAPEHDVSAVHLSIIEANALQFKPSLYITFPDYGKILVDAIRSHNAVVVHTASDVRNAYFWVQSCVPEYEVIGYRAILIESAEPFVVFSIFRTLYRYADVYEKTKTVLHEYAREFCKIIPNEKVSSAPVLASPADEDAKLLRLIVHVMETLAEIHPLVIVIPDWSLLDMQSKQVCEYIAESSSMKIKILITSHERIDWLSAYNFESRLLTKNEFSRLLQTVFYYYPLTKTVEDDIYTITSGDCALIADGFAKAAELHEFFVDNGAISLRRPSAYYFDIVGAFEIALKNVSDEICRVLHVMIYFEGRIPFNVIDDLSAEYKEIFHEAVAQQFLIKTGNSYHFRYSFFLQHIQKVLPNPMLNSIVDVLCNKLYDDSFLMVPLMKILFDLSRYDEFVESVEKLLKMRDEKPKNNDISRYIWICIIESEKVIDNVTRSHKFFIYENLLWLNTRHGKYDNQELLRKLKENMSSQEENIRYLTALFGSKNPSENELDAALPLFEKSEGIAFTIRWRLLSSYVSCLSESGNYEKGISVYTDYVEPRIKELNPRMQFDAYNSAEVMYSRLRNQEKGWAYLTIMKDLAEKNPDFINENLVFTLYNNIFVHLRQEGKDAEGFEYAHKAIGVAKKSHDYRKLALIYNNMGAGLFWNNQRTQACEYYKLCLENSFKAKVADYILLGTRNIVDYYDSVHQYSHAFEALHKGFEYLPSALSIMQKSNISKIAAWTYYEIGSWDEGDVYLEQIKELLKGHQFSLAEEFQYFAIEAMHIYHAQGRESALIFVRNIPQREKLVVSTKALIFVYLYILHYLFLQKDKEFVKELLRFIEEHPDEIPNTTNYNFIALIALLRIWVGFDEFRNDCVCIGLIEEPNLIILYHYLYCQNRKDSDIMWYEHFYHMVRLLHFAYSTLPETYRTMYCEQAPLYCAYEPFVIEHGLSIATFKYNVFPKKYRLKGTEYIQQRRNEFFKHATFSNLAETSQMIQRSISEALTVSGFERGIYFEYDKSQGWIKRNEVHNPIWYRENEAHIEEIVTDVLREQEDKLLFFKKKHFEGGLGVTEAICFPVIDITMARDRNMKKSSSSTSLFHLLSLKGAFYFDTKFALVQPNREDVYHLFYLRELINLGLYHNKLKEDMLLDPLTGLYKRETWFDMTKSLINVAADQNKRLTIMMTDIDFFKAVNDVYGHKTGDMVLQKVAKSTLQSLRVIDIGGRYGGEEFIYCLVDTAGDSAMKAAERLRLAVQHASILTDKQVTLSAGMACFPFDGTLLSDLIEKADKALLAAKESGRNRCMAWKESASFADKVERHAVPVISNPSREKDKIDCVIELVDTVSLLNGAENMVDELRNVCSRYLEIEELLFVIFCDGKKQVFPRQLASLLTEDYLSESLDEHTQLFAARPGKDCEYGLYFQIKQGSQKPLLEKRFYRFVAGVLLERLMAASLAIPNDE